MKKLMCMVSMLLILGGCGGIASKETVKKISTELNLSDIQKVKLQHLLQEFQENLYDFDKEKKRLRFKLSEMVGEEKFDKVVAKKKVTDGFDRMEKILDEMINDTEKFYADLTPEQKMRLRDLIKKHIDDESTGIF